MLRRIQQDVFLSFFEKISAFEERAAIGTWLYRVATNAAPLRRRGKRLELEVSLKGQLPIGLRDSWIYPS